MSANVKLKIKKGDQVLVISGKDKGKKGEVIRVLPRDSRVVVAGVNKVKKHTKPNPMAGTSGGIVEKELPLHISNVQLLDPKTGEASRVGIKFLEDGRKVRFAKKSKEVLDN